MTYNNDYSYTVDEIKDRIGTKISNYPNKPYEWEELVNSFNEEEVKVMREYFLSSDYPFYDVPLTDADEVIIAFMRLMAAEYIVVDNDIGLATDICRYFLKV